MHLLLSHLLLLLGSLLTFTTASPIWRHITQQVLSALPQAHFAQQVLSALPHPRTHKTPPGLYYKPSSYLDIRANSVGLALTTAEDGMARYFFLPVGRNVQTR